MRLSPLIGSEKPVVPLPSTCSAIAIIPGRMTRNGNSILGNAAMIGVRRAALMFSAAIARWMTRKSVHQ